MKLTAVVVIAVAIAAAIYLACYGLGRRWVVAQAEAVVKAA